MVCLDLSTLHHPRTGFAIYYQNKSNEEGRGDDEALTDKSHAKLL